jgi:hypothetical protein
MGATVLWVRGFLAQLSLSKAEQDLNLKSGQSVILTDAMDQEFQCRVNRTRGNRIQVDCDSSLELDEGAKVKIRRLWKANSQALPPYYVLVGVQYSFGSFQYSILNSNSSVAVNGVLIPSLRAAHRFGTDFYFGGSLNFGNLQDSSTSNQINQTLIHIYAEYPLPSFRVGLQYFLNASWTDTGGVKSGNGFGLTASYDLGRQFYLLADYHLMNIQYYQNINLFNVGLGYQF